MANPSDSISVFIKGDVGELEKQIKSTKLTVDVGFSRPQIQRALKDIKPNPTIKVDAVFSRPQVQAALKSATKGLQANVTVVYTDKGKEKQLQQVKDFNKKVAAEEARTNELRKRQSDKYDADEISSFRKQQDNKQKLVAQTDAFVTRSQITTAQQRERGAQNLENRLGAIAAQAEATRANRAFSSALSEQRRLQRLADKPILQTVRVNFDKVSNGLSDFDRLLTRGLSTSLKAFTVWSAGVVALTGAAATAGVASFAKLETAVARASAVAASSQIGDEIEKTGHQVSNFNTIANKFQKEITAVANQNALRTLFSPEESAQGIKTLLQAGFSLKDAIKEIGTVSRFAQNEELDLNKAVEDLAGGLSAAGDKTLTLTQLTDKFTFAANAAQGSADQVAEAFANRGASAFTAYGKSADAALTIITLLAKTNVVGAEAGTQSSIIIRDLSKAYGKNAEAFEKAGIKFDRFKGRAVSTNETLVQLAAAIDKVRKNEGAPGIARLTKELGFTQKSFGSILQILPQIAKEGKTGIDAITNGLANSAGTTARQSEVFTKTIAFQFGNLFDAIKIEFNNFGEGASSSIKTLVDAFNGPGGLIPQVDPLVRRLGARFGELVTQFSKFATSEDAKNGAKTLVDAIGITLQGVGDAFKAFSSAFRDSDGAQSTFESIATSIKGFAQLSATVLPVVAGIIGRILKTLIDNKDAFKTVAEITLALYGLRKAYTLFIRPVLLAKEAVEAFMVVQASAGAIGGLNAAAKILAEINTAYKAIEVSATAAAGAEEAAALAGKGGAAGGVGAFGSKIAERTAARRTAKVAGTGATAEATIALGGATTEATGLLGVLTGIGETLISIGGAFAELAPPIAIVTAIALAAAGAVKGFVDEIRKGPKQSAELKASIQELRPVFSAVFTAIKVTVKAVVGTVKALIVGVFKLGADVGRQLARSFENILVVFGDVATGVKRLINGDITGALRAFGAAIVNLLLAPIKTTIALIIDESATLVGTLANLPGKFGKPFKAAEKSMRSAARSIQDIGIDLDRTSEKSKAAEKQAGALSDSFAAVGYAADKATPFIKGAVDAAGGINLLTDKTSALLNQARGTGENSDIARAILGIGTASEATAKIVEKLKTQLGTDAKPFQDLIGDSVRQQIKSGAGIDAFDFKIKLTPEIQQEAVNAIETQINQLRRKREAIIALGLPKDQETQLIGAINQQIIAARKFVQKNPIIIGVNIAGTQFGAQNRTDSVATQIATQRAAIEAALKDPALVNSLTAAQKDLFDKVKANLQVAGSNPFGGLTGLIPSGEEIDNAINAAFESARGAKTGGGARIVGNFTKYAQDVAAGISTGVNNSKGILTQAGVDLAAPTQQAYTDFWQIASPSKVTAGYGRNLAQGVAAGITAGTPAAVGVARLSGVAILAGFQQGEMQYVPRLYAFNNQVALGVVAQLANAIPGAHAVGVAVMNSLQAGMSEKFGDLESPKKGTIGYYLHHDIPEAIKRLKGPVSYDATILVPAGEAVMGGLDKGLRSGFGGVESFLKRVGPSMTEFVPDNIFSQKTADFMVDVALGKNPDADKFFADLVPNSGVATYAGDVDPTLSFLHKTASLLDTQQMASKLAKLFGLQVTSTNNHSTFTSSGNISDHVKGWAADLSNGVLTPQEDALAKALGPLQGSIIKQLIWRNHDQKNGAVIPGHENHVHVAFNPTKDFAFGSGKIGAPDFRIPGASPLVAQAIALAAQKFHLPVALLAAVAKQESGFRPNVISGDGGYGLFQLTSPGLKKQAGSKILDPFVNANVGAGYLKSLLDQFGGNIFKALEGYNGGPGAAQHPFAQVIHYAESVLRFMREFGGFREHGGPVNSGRAYVVGERGPEIFRPGVSGTIISNRNATAASSSPTFVDSSSVHITSNASDPRAVAAIVEANRRRRLQKLSINL